MDKINKITSKQTTMYDRLYKMIMLEMKKYYQES